MCVCVSHLALLLSLLPSPPHLLGHRFSAAGSAGDTHQTPAPPSVRSSWPVTAKGGHEEKVCWGVKNRAGRGGSGSTVRMACVCIYVCFYAKMLAGGGDVGGQNGR